MNYERLYEKIINQRKNNLPEGYSEQHHILPKCLGGNDSSDNIVRLTAREHFICHFLLAKMYQKDTVEWYKMNHAFMMMKCSSVIQNRYFNSRLYESLKENFSLAMSASQQGKNNSQYGTRWIHNPGQKQSIKLDKSKPLPAGWNEGRIMNFDPQKEFATRKAYCKKCELEYHPKKSEQYCSTDCKLAAFRERSPTRKWGPILKSLELTHSVTKGTVIENRDFVLAAIAEGATNNQILWHLGCNNSGANYKTLKQIITPTSGS